MTKKEFVFDRKIEVTKDRPTFNFEGPLTRHSGNGSPPPSQDTSWIAGVIGFVLVVAAIALLIAHAAPK